MKGIQLFLIPCISFSLLSGSSILKLLTGRTETYESQEAKRELHYKLLEALRAKDLVLVKDLLKADVNPNSHVGKFSPLDITIQCDSPESAELLLIAGAFPGFYTSDCELTYLHCAAAAKWPLALLELFIEKGARINVCSSIGHTPLTCALEFPSILPAKMDSVADERTLSTIEFLLKKGAQVNRQGSRPVLFSVLRMNTAGKKSVSVQTRCFEMLIAAGADYTVRDHSTQDTLLHRAAKKLVPGIITILVEKGLSLTARNKEGLTPLHCIVSLRNHNRQMTAAGLRRSAKKPERAVCLQLLLDAGARTHIQDTRNRMTTFSIPYNEHLVSNEVDLPIVLKTMRGFTPFMLSVLWNYEPCIDVFVERAMKSRTKKFHVLHECAVLGAVERFYKILKRGIPLEIMDTKGRIAFHFFARNKRMKELSELIGYANILGDQSLVEKSIGMTYALFPVTESMFITARSKIFQCLLVIQARCKLPAYIVSRVLGYLPEFDQDLTTILIHELESGNPSSSPLLSGAKELLVERLLPQSTKFFASALQNRRMWLKINDTKLRYSGFRGHQRSVQIPHAIVGPEWLKKNCKELMLAGIKSRFKQLRDRSTALKSEKSC